MTAYVDTSVVIALLDEADPHHEWSWGEYSRRKADGPIIISDIVYCEVSMGMPNRESVDDAVRTLGLERVRISDSALFRAGRAFLAYKTENAGPKLGVLPDFLIGSEAESRQMPLLTANPKDFIKYFPDLEVHSPL